MKNLDLHGKNRYEAQVLVESFLYESFCSGEYFVCIVHGYGSSVLRDVVNLILKESKYVKSYEYAPPNYGGAGARIVYLKGRREVS